MIVYCHCGILWYTMVHCGILWYTMVHCGILWYTVVYCGILWYTVVHYGILWYTVVYCDTLWVMTLCNTSSKQTENEQWAKKIWILHHHFEGQGRPRSVEYKYSETFCKLTASMRHPGKLIRFSVKILLRLCTSWEKSPPALRVSYSLVPRPHPARISLPV